MSPFLKSLSAALGEAPFRGTVVENAKRFRLVGAAYKSMPPEQDGFFWLETARQLTGPLAALSDDQVREVGIIGATQVLKSVAGNVWLPCVMEHDPGDALVLFENDEKGLDFAVRRLMPTIKAHPNIKARLESETGNRHDVTRTKIRLTSMSLDVGGLNDSNVSTFSYRYIWISESWQHHDDGMLMKAIKRADRYRETCKILVESQAGLAGGDLHRWAKAGHVVPLTWECPHCAGRQTWECTNEFANVRTDDFVPLPRLDGMPVEPPKPGSYSGMKFDPAEKDVNGTVRALSIDERARSAYWECHWCGSRIDDRPEVRKAIAATYRQDYQIEVNGLKISPRQVVFYLPKESAWNNTFEDSVKSYLTAKAAKEAGNTQPYQDWMISERARFYDPREDKVFIPAVTATIDPNIAIPNERFRTMLVDCQKDIEASEKDGRDRTGHFWWTAEAVDVAGNTFQLGRGYATSWREWIDKYRALKIPTENVLVDGRFLPDEVREQAALNRDIKTIIEGNKRRNVLVTWKMLGGSARNRWMHPDGVARIYSASEPKPVSVRLPSGQWLNLTVPWIEWSNFHVTNQLHMLRSGMPGKPKFVALPAESELLSPITRAKEKEKDFSYESQMNSQLLGEERKKPKWVDVHKQQHYADCAKMGVVLKLMAGLLGAVAPTEEQREEVGN